MGMLTGLGDCPLAFGDNPDRLCAWCGSPLTGRRRRWCSDHCSNVWGDNHAWTAARFRACIRFEWRCVRCGSRPIEIHHIHQIFGRHAENGCHHHQDGLVALCHEHHLEETNRQRAARRLGVQKGSGMPVESTVTPTLW